MRGWHISHIAPEKDEDGNNIEYITGYDLIPEHETMELQCTSVAIAYGIDFDYVFKYYPYSKVVRMLTMYQASGYQKKIEHKGGTNG